MNGSLSIPTTVGATIVASTCAKMTELPHKPKRGKRLQPCKPLNRVWCHMQFSFYSKLRTSPLDTGRKQAVHLLVETVEPGRRKATFSTRLDRLRKIALRHPGFLENEALESRATSAAVKGPYAAPGTVFSQGGPCSCGLQE